MLANKNNLLNEIAANNQLLQNHSSIQGTPIPRAASYPTLQSKSSDKDSLDDLDLSEQKPEQKPAEKPKPVEKPETKPKKKTSVCPLQPPKIIKVPEKPNYTIEYLVVPIILAILFFVLVYPKTSKLLEKYLPALNNTKGIIARSILFAVLYVIIKFIVSFFGNKKN
jgi:hypothetical protein